MTNYPSIAIAIVDDHTLFRQGLMSLLSEYHEISIVFEAANGVEMKEKITRNPLPDVILMDINMPVMDGYEAAKWLKQNYPDIKILALSTFEEDKPIINMLKSGVGGYLLKESRITEVVKAITVMHTQGYFLNELISAKMLRNIQTDASFPSLTSRLTSNEITFLRLCCSELTYKEIANEMKLSPHTIDNYRQELFEKLSIRSRTGLVLYAIKNDIFIP
ncbi:response regulator [Chitinophaga sp. SYP-B3965]|uniref:response regulator transcription factor n=1 Tax=Chitinophaga sp. SYP-B3965 TaxID=2663120 RepID=UPI001299F9A0|nr:response regulator transcription factor [Chitinophaga sp. SYP-B3965]MRG44480.1 response regulator [Chitinophaga sp. SYP-B3965]